MEESLLKLMHRSTLFQGLSEKTLRKIASYSNLIVLKRGEFLISAIEEKREFYLLTEGRLGFFLEGKYFGEMKELEFIGETVLLTKEKWPFDIVAIRSSEVLALSEKAFFLLIEESLSALHEIIHKHAEQTEEILTQKKPFPSLKRLGFFPVNGTANERGFIEDFAAFLKQETSVIWKKGGDFASENDEQDYRWVILEETSHSLSSLANYSDHVFLVSEKGGVDISPHSLPNCENPFMDLILLHSEKKMEKEQGSSFRLHHIWGRKDIQRFYRYITGNSIQLVLGGGSAKTAAQIGIIAVLEENHIPIDAIGGVGLGALIGALYAQGRPFSEIHRLLKNIYTNALDLLDFTLPIVSFIKGKKIQNLLQTIFTDTRIEDLVLPFFCISSDLNFHEAHIHNKGLLWKAVRASFSIPGIFPPVFFEDKILVHGSLTNALPIDVMHGLEPGKIIAIDTDTQREWDTPKRLPPYLSGWKYLLFRQKGKVPNIFQILLSSAMLSSSQKKNQLLEEFPSDIILSPPLKQFSSKDFAYFDDLFEIGYQYAKENVNEWKKKLKSL